MSTESPKNVLDSGKDRLKEQIKKHLDALKKTVGKEKIGDEVNEVNMRIEFFDGQMQEDLSNAKSKGLTSEEEKVINGAYNRYKEDMKRHPTAYIRSDEDVEKHGYKVAGGSASGYCILDDYEISRSLGAEFKLTSEEKKLIKKYGIVVLW